LWWTGGPGFPKVAKWFRNKQQISGSLYIYLLFYTNKTTVHWNIQAKKFIGILQRKAELQTKSLFTVSEMKEVAAQARIVVPDFNNFVATLNLQGFLLKKGANIYQLQSVDY